MPHYIRTACGILAMGTALYANPAAAETLTVQNQIVPGKTVQWEPSSQWLYEAMASRFADHAGDYQTAMQTIEGVAKQSKQYDVYQYSYDLAMDTGQIPQGMEIARSWVEQYPDDSDARLALARVYLLNDQQDLALEQIQTLLLSDAGPQNVTQVIKLLGYEEDDQMRLEILQKLATQFSDNPYIYYYLGLMAKEQGRISIAINAFGHALALDGRWRQLELMQAETLSGVGRLEEARKMMDDLRTRYPNDLELISSEIDMLVDHYQWQDALILAKKWEELSPKDPRLDQLVAWLHTNNGDLEAAEAAYRPLLERGEMDEDQYLFQVAQAALNAGDSALARDLLALVPQGSTLYMISQQQIALMAFDNQDIPSAQAQFAQMREQFPEYALEMFLIEISRLDGAGAHVQAGDILAQALKKFPDQVDILYAQAEHQSAIGDIDGAEKTYQRILQLDAGNIDALNAYGYLLLTKTDRQKEAAGMIQKAIYLYPDSPAVQDSYGWMLFLQGDAQGALVWLQRAYSAYRRGEITAHYVEVLAALGQLPLAKAIYGYERHGQPENHYLRETGRKLDFEQM